MSGVRWMPPDILTTTYALTEIRTKPRQIMLEKNVLILAELVWIQKPVFFFDIVEYCVKIEEKIHLKKRVWNIKKMWKTWKGLKTFHVHCWNHTHTLSHIHTFEGEITHTHTRNGEWMNSAFPSLHIHGWNHTHTHTAEVPLSAAPNPQLLLRHEDKVLPTVPGVWVC